MVEDPALAELLVAWQAAVARTNPGGPLFPPALELRGMMNRALRAPGQWRLSSKDDHSLSIFRKYEVQVWSNVCVVVFWSVV